MFVYLVRSSEAHEEGHWERVDGVFLDLQAAIERAKSRWGRFVTVSVEKWSTDGNENYEGVWESGIY